MSRVVTCKSCGAENDVIFESCIYCGSILDNNSLDVIPNEELVSNAASWIETIQENSVSLDSVNSDGKKVHRYLSNSEIKGYAKKYLSILQYRALRNPELNKTCEELSNRFSAISKKRFRVPIIVLISMLLFPLFIFYIGISSQNSGANNEKERINEVTEEITTLIEKKEYEKAIIKVDQITWKYKPKVFPGEAEKTDQQRDNLRETILLLMEQDKR